MTVRPFLIWPDKRLRMVVEPVGAVTDEVRAIWDDMLDTMYAMPGIGLAGPQIGVMLRLAVVDCSTDKKAPLRLADPELLHVSDRFVEFEEGSPNLLHVHAKVKRPRGITVSFIDHLGLRVRQDFVGLWAVSIQHQIDHLNGRMYFDRLGSVKRQMLLSKAAKLAKREV
ncbi:MAG: peptide deformylase [Rhodobacterales bacterium]|jgi:peptide deformylase|nr:peptide deformylase [Pseudomonadota bacterium]MDA1287575.1 peptide deformylase [Pseudomonadota bacterium]NQW14042.1 peptide deformylase [Rhodobacter sp.]HBN31808.1 peptide deformylase [Paracoccaceae bacterium]